MTLPSFNNIARRISPYVPAPIVVAARYPREFLFDKGLLRIEESRASVVFFTCNKTASKFMRRMMLRINKDALGLVPLNLAGYYWNNLGGIPVQEYLAKNSEKCFRDFGVFYGPLRNYISLPHLRNARVFTLLRDPRDQLVASYMWAHMHRPPVNSARREVFLAHQREISESSLEENVLKFAPRLALRYAAYRLNAPRETLLLYEQLWQDIEGFFNELSRVLKINLDSTLRNELAMMVDEYFSVRDETGKITDRIGEPGEFRYKLSDSAINKLTDIFSDTLDWMYG